MEGDDQGAQEQPRGELVVVGTGYRAIGDLTLQAESYISKSDAVFYLVSDPLCTQHILQVNPDAQALMNFYHPDKPREESHQEMAERIVEEVRKQRLVCAVFYGHPGVFVTPSHLAIERARAEGFPAHMLPAASAEDWIFADLGIDPARDGCQSYDASDFLLRGRVFDPTSLLILWQVGLIGLPDPASEFDPRRGVELLVEILRRIYLPEHRVTVYEASPYVVCAPRIEQVRLGELPETTLTATSTLIIPPFRRRPVDRQIAKRIGLSSAAAGGLEPGFPSRKAAHLAQAVRTRHSQENGKAR